MRQNAYPLILPQKWYYLSASRSRLEARGAHKHLSSPHVLVLSRLTNTSGTFSFTAFTGASEGLTCDVEDHIRATVMFDAQM